MLYGEDLYVPAMDHIWCAPIDNFSTSILLVKYPKSPPTRCSALRLSQRREQSISTDDYLSDAPSLFMAWTALPSGVKLLRKSTSQHTTRP